MHGDHRHSDPAPSGAPHSDPSYPDPEQSCPSPSDLSPSDLSPSEPEQSFPSPSDPSPSEPACSGSSPADASYPKPAGQVNPAGTGAPPGLQDRLLPLEGVMNFRDMGGYVTRDGRRVRRGILFRSGELAGMTERDKELFRSLGIKTIVDYRGLTEAKERPDPEFEGVMHVHLPALRKDVPSGTGVLIRLQAEGVDLPRFLEQLYADIAFDNPSYRRLMALVTDPDRLGLVHHCAGGRDRTGLGAAFILLALGVPRETILEDYLLSNRALAPAHAKLREKLAAKFPPEQAERILEGLILRRETLQAVFSAIDERYGNDEAFLEGEFGLDAGRLRAFRDRCLE